MNKLMEELATISIAEFDAESRFRAMAARGSAKKGLALLDKLDAAFRKSCAMAPVEFQTVIARGQEPERGPG